jgi:hypothetical protein
MSDKEKEFDDVVDVLRVKYTEDGWLDSELVNETIKAFKQAKLILPDVSQHRELLKAYAELIQKDYTHHFFDDAVEESIDQFLSL